MSACSYGCQSIPKSGSSPPHPGVAQDQGDPWRFMSIPMGFGVRRKTQIWQLLKGLLVRLAITVLSLPQAHEMLCISLHHSGAWRMAVRREGTRHRLQHRSEPGAKCLGPKPHLGSCSLRNDALLRHYWGSSTQPRHLHACLPFRSLSPPGGPSR